MYPKYPTLPALHELLSWTDEQIADYDRQCDEVRSQCRSLAQAFAASQSRDRRGWPIRSAPSAPEDPRKSRELARMAGVSGHDFPYMVTLIRMEERVRRANTRASLRLVSA